jgi:hypothetical protein
MIPSIYDLQTFCYGNHEDCLVFQTKGSKTAAEVESKKKKDLSEAV